jgi:hypothetical protein
VLTYLSEDPWPLARTCGRAAMGFLVAAWMTQQGKDLIRAGLAVALQEGKDLPPIGHGAREEMVSVFARGGGARSGDRPGGCARDPGGAGDETGAAPACVRARAEGQSPAPPLVRPSVPCVAAVTPGRRRLPE